MFENQDHRVRKVHVECRTHSNVLPLKYDRARRHIKGFRLVVIMIDLSVDNFNSSLKVNEVSL